MTHQRDLQIDLMKTIAIFLVTIGHSSIGSINNLIYSFHMPLFFALSGFFLTKYFEFPRLLIKKRFFSLIIPALAIGVVTFAIRFTIEDDANFHLWSERHSLGFALTYLPWFLVTLYIIISLIVFIKYYVKNDVLTTLLVLLISLTLPTNTLYINVFLPFVWSGYVIKKYFWNNIHNKFICILSLICFIVLFFTIWDSTYLCYSFDNIVLTHSDISINTGALKGVAIQLAIGLAGTIFIISAVKNLPNSNKLETLSSIGKNTLGIYALQYILFNLPFIQEILTTESWWLGILYGIALTFILNVAVVGIRYNRYSKMLVLGE